MCIDVVGVLLTFAAVLVAILAIVGAFNYFGFVKMVVKRTKQQVEKESKRLRHRMDGFFYMSEARFRMDNGKTDVGDVVKSVMAAADNFFESKDYELLFEALGVIEIYSRTGVIKELKTEDRYRHLTSLDKFLKLSNDKSQRDKMRSIRNSIESASEI